MNALVGTNRQCRPQSLLRDFRAHSHSNNLCGHVLLLESDGLLDCNLIKGITWRT
eukprot:EC787442.1.p3 GENE.EC787442.1~~EC787442.1.p3  ORF type:complete len:55 (-),score=9.82 EC787442.1:44-208(-)